MDVQYIVLVALQFPHGESKSILISIFNAKGLPMFINTTEETEAKLRYVAHTKRQLLEAKPE